MYRIKLDKLTELYKVLSSDADLFLPVNENGHVDFKKWSDEANVDLDKLKTAKSAKDVFFPQTQDIVDFKVNGKEIKVEEPKMPDKLQVLFGVRACDQRSFDILDMAFLEEFGDKFYEERRKNTTIITLACSKPDEACFCNVYGIDATNPKGDVSSWKTEEYLYLQPLTDKGNALIDKVKSLLEKDVNESEVENQKKECKEIMKKLPFANLNLKGLDKDHLMELFNSDKWKTLSEACLGCGTCTFVCPTCQCYDIRDFKTKDGVKRFRCWDSCMYSDFTKTAGGQSRPTQMQRFRQRFMHKLCYFPSNHDGVYSCVGCGRCVQKCPQMLNIVKVIKALEDDKND